MRRKYLTGLECMLGCRLSFCLILRGSGDWKGAPERDSTARKSSSSLKKWATHPGESSLGVMCNDALFTFAAYTCGQHIYWMRLSAMVKRQTGKTNKQIQDLECGSDNATGIDQSVNTAEVEPVEGVHPATVALPTPSGGHSAGAASGGGPAAWFRSCHPLLARYYRMGPPFLQREALGRSQPSSAQGRCSDSSIPDKNLALMR